MRVTPNLGIGDLLVFKMRSMVANIQVTSVNVQSYIAHTYRKHGETYLRFLDDFIPRLFPGAIVERDTGERYTNIENIPVMNCYMYLQYKFSVPRSVYSEQPYVIIHTRARFHGTSPDVLKYLHGRAFSELRSSYPILLFGEQDIEPNPECTVERINSLYAFLIQIPGVVDMTRNSSASSNSIEEFERDIHFINGAKCNVVFGYGGPLSLSVAFGRNTLGYIGDIEHPVVYDYMKVARLYCNIDEFFDVLRIELSIK